MIKLAVLDNIRALPETQAEIKNLAHGDVSFPESPPRDFDDLVVRTDGAEVVLASTANCLKHILMPALRSNMSACVVHRPLVLTWKP